jgi:hypothetical protein
MSVRIDVGEAAADKQRINLWQSRIPSRIEGNDFRARCNQSVKIIRVVEAKRAILCNSYSDFFCRCRECKDGGSLDFSKGLTAG